MTKLPEGVEFVTLTEEKVENYWNRLKCFDRLFTDQSHSDKAAFYRWLLSDTSFVFEIEGGIVILDRVIRGLKGNIHAGFWDKKLSAKTDKFQKALIWAFITFDLYRIEANIPEFCRALRRFLEKRLNFKYEGRERDSYWYKGNLTDRIILSLLRREVLDNGK